MSISNPPIDNLSPFNPVKFGSYPTLTVDYLDSLFLSKRNSTESVSPETTFQNLLKVSNIIPNTNNAHTIGTALLKMLGIYTSNLYVDDIYAISNPYFRIHSDIIFDFDKNIQVTNIDVNNINSQSILALEAADSLTLRTVSDAIYAKSNFVCEQSLIVPYTAYLQNIRKDNADPINILDNISLNGKNISNVQGLFYTSIYARSPVDTLTYYQMPYFVCESMTGASYNLPSGPAGSNIMFKGVINGIGGSSQNLYASYEIKYVMSLTNNVNPGSYTFICAFGGITASAITIIINEIGTLLLTFQINFQVTASTPTNATLLTYSTVEAISTNVYRNQSASVGVGINTVNYILTPSFFVNTTSTPPQWSATRRDYSFIRKY